MRFLLAISFLVVFAQQQMVEPKVEHHQQSYTTTTDTITRTCPDGYEGHFVDPNSGFAGVFVAPPSFGDGVASGGRLAYTICFKKDFMDNVRKNGDLLTAVPIIRGA